MNVYQRDLPMPRSCWLLLLATTTLLGACVTSAPRQDGRDPSQVKADIARRIPATIADRQGWANDVYVALTAQRLDPSADNVCAVLAVVAQESTFQANPVVPHLGRIAHDEIVRRANAHHVPTFVVDAALKLKSPNGTSYADRIANAKTEKDLSDLFDDFIGSVPLGQALFGDFNPVHTAGPMQVSIAFAEAHDDDYPYPPDTSIRAEVFSRRGGLYFGTKHLLGYPASYDRLLYRFADFNAGWYASRNAAFQAALSRVTGISLALDGDLLIPDAGLDAPSNTELAARTLRPALGMSDRAIRRALEQGDSIEFERSDLYREVFAMADKDAGRALPRAVLPGIKLESPKITRHLTTAWFAERVNGRWKRCMAR